jgi:hypothetical protein
MIFLSTTSRPKALRNFKQFQVAQIFIKNVREIQYAGLWRVTSIDLSKWQGILSIGGCMVIM